MMRRIGHPLTSSKDLLPVSGPCQTCSPMIYLVFSFYISSFPELPSILSWLYMSFKLTSTPSMTKLPNVYLSAATLHRAYVLDRMHLSLNSLHQIYIGIKENNITCIKKITARKFC